MAWSAQEQNNIRNFYNSNKGDVATIQRGMGELGITADQMAQYTGQSLDSFNNYLSGGNQAGSMTNTAGSNNYAAPAGASVASNPYALKPTDTAQSKPYTENPTGTSQAQGGSVADQQARINAWASSNGMQAPNLSDPGFAYLMTGGSDATANWIRQNIGARTMQGGSGNSYTTGVTPTNPKGNTNVDPTDRNMSVTPNITQGQANTNNYWANAANSYLGGNNDWANNAPGFTPTQSYSANGLNTMSMDQAMTPVSPQGSGNGYNPRDARYRANPRVGNLGYGGEPWRAIGSGTINPWGYDLGNTLVRQSGQDFNDNIMPALRSSAQAAGQYGGSRQGMAGGIAAGRSMDALTSGLAQLYGGLYNTDQSNTTTRIGQGLNYDLGIRGDLTNQQGLANSYDLGLRSNLTNQQQLANVYDLGRRTDLTNQQQLANSYDLGRRSDVYQLGQLGLASNTANQNFYNANRSMDLSQYQLGANMFQGGVAGNLGIGSGMTQLGNAAQTAPLTALQQYQAMIQPFSGINSTPTTNYTGGPNAGAAALGGALGYGQIGRNLYNQYQNNGTTTGQAGTNLASQGQSQGWM